MNITQIKFLLLIFLSLSFNLLFWGEYLGPNLSIFALLLIGASLILFPEAKKHKSTWILVAGVVFTSILLVFYGSTTARVAVMLTTMTAVGSILYPNLRSVVSIFPMGFLNALLGSMKILEYLFEPSKNEKKPVKRRYALFSISLIPLLIAGLFLLIYSGANPKIANILGNIGDWISTIFVDFPIERVGFILLGGLISAGFIWKLGIFNGDNLEDGLTDDLTRKRTRLRRNRMEIGLRKELRAGIILLILLNALGLFVNIIDISWIWFNFTLEPGMNLSQLVHEGTYLLILSILLAMAVVFILFRKNLNFISNNKPIRMLAYAWLVQNTIMVISVAIRNFHYMDYHGLAYKRIGVYFFLLLTLFGLATVAWKIYKKKSFFFVLRANGWATWALLLLLTVFNWDIVIARHNINHYSDKDIDTEFLLSLSDKALPILCEHPEIFPVNSDNVWRYRRNDQAYFYIRLKEFAQSYDAVTWLSHSVADYQALTKVENFLKLHPQQDAQ